MAKHRILMRGWTCLIVMKCKGFRVVASCLADAMPVNARFMPPFFRQKSFPARKGGLCRGPNENGGRDLEQLKIPAPNSSWGGNIWELMVFRIVHARGTIPNKEEEEEENTTRICRPPVLSAPRRAQWSARLAPHP